MVCITDHYSLIIMSNFLNDEPSIRRYLEQLCNTTPFTVDSPHFKLLKNGTVNLYEDNFNMLCHDAHDNFVDGHLKIDIGTCRKLYIESAPLNRTLTDFLTNTIGFPTECYDLVLKLHKKLINVNIDKMHYYDSFAINLCNNVETISDINSKELNIMSCNKLTKLKLTKRTDSLLLKNCKKIVDLSDTISYNNNKFRDFFIVDCQLSSLKGLPQHACSVHIEDYYLEDVYGLTNILNNNVFYLDAPNLNKNLSLLLLTRNNIVLCENGKPATPLYITHEYLQHYKHYEYIMDYTLKMLDCGHENSL